MEIRVVMDNVISLEDRLDTWTAHLTQTQLLSKCRSIAEEQGNFTGKGYSFRSKGMSIKYTERGDISVAVERQVVLSLRCLGSTSPRWVSAALLRETGNGGTSFYQLLRYRAGEWELNVENLYARRKQKPLCYG